MQRTEKKGESKKLTPIYRRRSFLPSLAKKCSVICKGVRVRDLPSLRVRARKKPKQHESAFSCLQKHELVCGSEEEKKRRYFYPKEACKPNVSFSLVR